MIPIQHDGETGFSCERCCFCRTLTHYWSATDSRKPGEQVACCEHCASRADVEDLPTKRVWMRRERIAHRPTYGEISRGHDRVYPPAKIVERQD